MDERLTTKIDHQITILRKGKIIKMGKYIKVFCISIIITCVVLMGVQIYMITQVIN
jgi:cell division protein FtsL